MSPDPAEDHLRTLVREAIARHLGQSPPRAVGQAAPGWKSHPSHLRLTVPSGQQVDGPCLIEPVARCHHCGFCQSMGH